MAGAKIDVSWGKGGRKEEWEETCYLKFKSELRILKIIMCNSMFKILT